MSTYPRFLGVCPSKGQAEGIRVRAWAWEDVSRLLPLSGLARVNSTWRYHAR